MTERRRGAERTFANEGLETYERIYAAVRQDGGIHREEYTLTVLSRLIHALVEKGVLTEHELDELLLEAVG